MLSKKIKDFLDLEKIEYQVIEHEPTHSIYQAAKLADIPPEQVARTALLKEKDKCVLTVIPASHMLDFKILSDVLGAELSTLNLSDSNGIFKDCEPETRPPLPSLYGLEGIIDSEQFKHEFVYFEPGSHSCLLRVSKVDFLHIHRDSRSLCCACPPEDIMTQETEADIEKSLNNFMPKRIRQRIDETFDLPALPEIANEIMKLRVDPSAEAKDLANIVCKDPSLAAQVISWASSPYYGYQGQVSSVEIAISRVLGFDLVMNLALGIAIGKSLKIPDDGPLGLTNFWRQSVYCATLSERLCTLIAPKNRPQRGLVYLSGLLHNFGHLLLGHVFPPQFFIVNRYVETNAAFPVEVLERHVLGVTHEEMGAWLMQSWNMPEELIFALRHHHQEGYAGDHHEYANLVMIANCMLRRLSIGDAFYTEPPPRLLHQLGIEQSDIDHLFEKLIDRSDELEMLSKQLVA